MGRLVNKTSYLCAKVTQLKLVVICEMSSAFKSCHIFCFTLAEIPWPLMLSVGRRPLLEGYFRPSVVAVCQESVVTLNSCEKLDRNRVALSHCLYSVLVLSLSCCSFPALCLSLSACYDATEQENCHLHTVRWEASTCSGPPQRKSDHKTWISS